MIQEMQGDYVLVGDAGLTTLYERRKLGDLVEAFKTLAGKNNVVKEIWFQIASDEETRPSTRLNTNVKVGKEEKQSNIIIRERARTELRNNSFRFRIRRLWNDLLYNVRNAKNTSAFKNAYDSWFVNTNYTKSRRSAPQH